jgi:hypothetical protein
MMPIINKNDAENYKCPWNDFWPCIGEECMAWARVGRSHEYIETDNLTETPDGLRPDNGKAPPMPDGEGWEKDGPETAKGYHRSAHDKLPKARGQRWIRKVPLVNGFCGRATESHSQGYF